MPSKLFAEFVIPGPPILTANDLALSYGYQRLLESVTLSVAAGEKVGLVGRNGSGKTSLLRILAGYQQADAGEIARRRGLRIGYLPQEFELDPNLTVRENIEAGAADLMDWLQRYQSGAGSEAELAALLNQIESVDGWNFHARLNAEASALAAPPLDAHGRTAFGRGKAAGGALPRIGGAAGPVAAGRADKPPGR